VINASNAFALPSFSRQTGEACDSCHVGGYGPQLTPHGMKFKISGYTDNDNKGGHIPLAAMLVANLTHTKSDQDVSILPESSHANNNVAMQELSGFVGGQLVGKLGAFAQVTYSGVEKQTALDNVDLRYATDVKAGGGTAIVGVSVNNNPSVQDPFNTTPAWRFPYVTSDYAPGPEHAPVIDGALEQQVFGATVYTLLPNGIYAEAGGYHALNETFLNKMHVGAENHVSGVAPYWRLAYTKDGGGRWFSAGLFGIKAAINQFGEDGSTDKNTDVGIDGHYQFLGTRTHVLSVDGSFIHEAQTLDATGGGAEESLKQFNISGSYHYDKTYGLTVRHFNTTGTAEGTDSRGWTLQGDWTPFGKESSWKAPYANFRFGVQYTLFDKLNGATGVSGSNSVIGFL